MRLKIDILDVLEIQKTFLTIFSPSLYFLVVRPLFLAVFPPFFSSAFSPGRIDHFSQLYLCYLHRWCVVVRIKREIWKTEKWERERERERQWNVRRSRYAWGKKWHFSGRTFCEERTAVVARDSSMLQPPSYRSPDQLASPLRTCSQL